MQVPVKRFLTEPESIKGENRIDRDLPRGMYQCRPAAVDTFDFQSLRFEFSAVGRKINRTAVPTDGDNTGVLAQKKGPGGVAAFLQFGNSAFHEEDSRSKIDSSKKIDRERGRRTS